MALTARTIVRVSLVVVATFLVVAQFVPLDRSNPTSDPSLHFTAVAHPPPAVAAVFERSCHDCHSNDTAWPWYSRVAPVSWLLVDDVKEGRSHLNFSEWGKLDERRRARKLEDICDEVKSGEMPLWQYTLVHRGTAVTPAEVEAICGWTEQASQPASSRPGSEPSPPGSSARSRTGR